LDSLALGYYRSPFQGFQFAASPMGWILSERFSLTPALSRWERKNNLPMV
jgi:hypothetical protein